MALLLILDTCGEGGGVGVARDHSLLAHRDLPGRETQERLLPALDEVLKEAGVALLDLSAIAVVTGPGSFTGIRIGLAAAKGLAEATGLPLIALSRLAVLAAQAAPGAQAWIDAGRGDVFVRRTRQDGTSEEIMLPGTAARAGAAGDPVVAMKDHQTEQLSHARYVPPVGVAEALPLALTALQAKDFADTAKVDANYLRVPDAELALRARLASA